MLNIKKFSFNPFQENSYLLWDDSREGIIIDPGCFDSYELEELYKYISDNNLNIKAIWLTHAHFDHIYGVKSILEKYKLNVYLDPQDKIIIENNTEFAQLFGMKAPDNNFQTIDIHDGDKLSFGNTDFLVISTPGHSPGGVCFYNPKDKILISGDTLFAGSIGRTDNKWGDYDKLIVGIMDKLMGLEGDVKVYPGHGPSTDIGYERTHNPFLQPFNEPEEEMNWDKEGINIHG